MASIDTGGSDSGKKKGRGVKKAKKLTTRIDMTPMVDLGFLLITFFIFTTTMSTPTTMDLNMPKDTQKQDEQTQVAQSGALTIMLGKDNQVYYYEGELKSDGSNFKQTTFKGIRDVIINKKQSVINSYVPSPDDEAIIQKAKAKGDPNWQNAAKDKNFTVIIKPDADATYKNTVDILDEMTINNVKRFAMIPITDSELQLIKATEASGK
ncbi:MAG: biopolymer transporter ExbD [Chitinophagaceae bacterium]|jgi:biopolymer transport protein ExbD|nr:biopolymer transporter ExbD [Chitinophagaceae bacterium]OQY96111.1 MAG: biopolymer transporter ExbD [Sphingobacteriales bacterium UTBCD1]